MKPSFDKYNHNKDNKTKYKRTHKQKLSDSKNVQNPIHEGNNGQIISGYFLDEKPYKELIIARVNRFLYIVLGALILFCLICYYFVSCKEVQLNKITRMTLDLNFENEELQNKVDSIQSYYNIDKAVSKSNILERAQQVVEVNAIDTKNVNFNKIKNAKPAIVVSY